MILMRNILHYIFVVYKKKTKEFFLKSLLFSEIDSTKHE